MLKQQATYELPLSLETSEYALSIRQEQQGWHYHRSMGDSEKEMQFLGNPTIRIQPIEPLSTPRAAHLQLDFETPVQLQPESRFDVFLTFPLELGIFLCTGSKKELLDVLAFHDSRLTLYGSPSDGVICRYWKTTCFFEKPEILPEHTGLIFLTIQNTDEDWIEVRKVVLSAPNIKVYFSDELTAMKVNMKIIGKGMAEVDCLEQPPEVGMTRALDAFPARKITASGSRFVMQKGLS